MNAPYAWLRYWIAYHAFISHPFRPGAGHRGPAWWAKSQRMSDALRDARAAGPRWPELPS